MGLRTGMLHEVIEAALVEYCVILKIVLSGRISIMI